MAVNAQISACILDYKVLGALTGCVLSTGHQPGNWQTCDYRRGQFLKRCPVRLITLGFVVTSSRWAVGVDTDDAGSTPVVASRK